MISKNDLMNRWLIGDKSIEKCLIDSIVVDNGHKKSMAYLELNKIMDHGSITWKLTVSVLLCGIFRTYGIDVFYIDANTPDEFNNICNIADTIKSEVTHAELEALGFVKYN